MKYKYTATLEISETAWWVLVTVLIFVIVAATTWSLLSLI